MKDNANAAAVAAGAQATEGREQPPAGADGNHGEHKKKKREKKLKREKRKEERAETEKDKGKKDKKEKKDKNEKKDKKDKKERKCETNTKYQTCRPAVDKKMKSSAVADGKQAGVETIHAATLKGRLQRRKATAKCRAKVPFIPGLHKERTRK